MIHETLRYQPFVTNGNDRTSQPCINNVADILESTGFYSEIPNSHGCVVLRGSVASLLPDDGTLTFRSKTSDIDFFAIIPEINPNATYKLFRVTVPGDDNGHREVNTLLFSPEYLDRELKSSLRTFLSTKLLQIGFPVQGVVLHNFYRKQAIGRMIRKGASIAGKEKITPSGAAKAALEADLYVEPWRKPSFQTTFIHSHQAKRNRTLIVQNCLTALNHLVEQGQAVKLNLTDDLTHEPMYELEIDSISHSAQHRLHSMIGFIMDQLVIVHYSGTLFTQSRMKGVLLKVWAALLNPSLSFDIDSIFE